MNQIATIRKFWQEKARFFHTSDKASWGDRLMVKEVREISKYLHDGYHVLDVGCANGNSSLQYIKKKHIELLGVDYAEEMIIYANEAKKRLPAEAAKRIKFRKGDATKLDVKKDYYDAVISTRCLCNLISWKDQKKALLGMWSALKPEGLLLLSEPTFQGLNELNSIGNFFHLKQLTPPWHNLYVDENKLLDFSKKLFTVKIDNFSGTYYFFSRILYRWFMGDDATKLKQESVWNTIGITLPSFGACGVQRLYIMKKIAIE
jgi:ubiquinone/menaquinone biosynthesis C-methylase UbiE